MSEQLPHEIFEAKMAAAHEAHKAKDFDALISNMKEAVEAAASDRSLPAMLTAMAVTDMIDELTEAHAKTNGDYDEATEDKTSIDFIQRVAENAAGVSGEAEIDDSLITDDPDLPAGTRVKAAGTRVKAHENYMDISLDDGVNPPLPGEEGEVVGVENDWVLVRWDREIGPLTGRRTHTHDWWMDAEDLNVITAQAA